MPTRPKRLRIVSDGISSNDVRIYLEDEEVSTGLRLAAILIEGGEVNACWLEAVPEEIDIQVDLEAGAIVGSAMPLAPSVESLGRRIDALAEELRELRRGRKEDSP